MRNRWLVWVLSGVLGGAAYADVAFNAVVLEFKGKTELQRAESGWEPAVAGTKLAEGDRVHTGFRATCALGFPDGSVVEVQPMSMIQLDRINISGVRTRARLLLKTGEVKAQVNRSTGAHGDFQVKTPTTTASVRGTEINRISYDESAGAQIRMGGHGLLAVLTPQGRAFLAANRASAVRQMHNLPLTPQTFARIMQSFDPTPQGSTDLERADARDLGVPRFGVGVDGGVALANRVSREPDARTVRIPPPRDPVVVEQPPLIPTPLPSPPIDVKPGTDGTRGGTRTSPNR